MNAIFTSFNSSGKKKQRQQSAVEFLSTYSWTFLILAMLITVLLIFISQKSPVNYLLNQCFLTSQITCLQDIITTNSTNILFAAKLNNYLGYSSLTYLQFGANSINVTLTGIGKNGTNTFYGNCYPMNTLVPYAGQTFCIVKIPKQLVPRQGQKISATYQISYNICTSGEKCASSNSYSQSGYTYLSFGGDFAEFVALTAGMPTPQNPVIGIGQSVTLHEDAYGGITPYTFAWFSGSSSNCTKDSLYAGNVSQITISPTSSAYYCYSVSDNYNQYALSPADFVQVVPPPAPLPNEVFTYGTQHTLTATAQLGSDTVEILINNKVVASGTGTASYTICSAMTMQTCLANATYSVKVYEVQTNEYSPSSVLTIQKAAPQLSLNSPSNFQYTGSGGTIYYGISTIGNQDLSTLYINNANVGSTTASSVYTTSSSSGTYSILLSSPPTQNYTAASRSASFTIFGGFSGVIYYNDTYSLDNSNIQVPTNYNWFSPYEGCINCPSQDYNGQLFFYAPPTNQQGQTSSYESTETSLTYSPSFSSSGASGTIYSFSGSGTSLAIGYTYACGQTYTCISRTCGRWGNSCCYGWETRYCPTTGYIHFYPGTVNTGGVYMLQNDIDFVGSGMSILDNHSSYSYNIQNGYFKSFSNYTSTPSSITYNPSTNTFSGSIYLFSNNTPSNWCSMQNLDQASGDYFSPPINMYLVGSGSALETVASEWDFHVYWHGNLGGHSSTCTYVYRNIGAVSYNPSTDSFSGETPVRLSSNYNIYLIGSGDEIVGMAYYTTYDICGLPGCFYPVSGQKYIGAIKKGV